VLTIIMFVLIRDTKMGKKVVRMAKKMKKFRKKIVKKVRITGTALWVAGVTGSPSLA
jgi:hypothetical protein